jgi:MADS-box transcription enhancer factor 2A
MGRKKITIELIGNSKDRMITFCKRKFGLLKKAAEISILCGVNVYLAFTDQNGNAYQFDSFRGQEQTTHEGSQQFLDKMRCGNVVNYDLGQYPFESLKYEHTLQEYDRQDDFMSNIERQLDFANSGSLRKRALEQLKGDSSPLDDQDSNSEAKEEVKMKKKRAFEFGDSLMTVTGHLNLGDLFESSLDAQGSNKSEPSLSEVALLQKRLASEFSYVLEKNCNLPTNESAVLDTFIFYCLVKKYLEAKKHELENKGTQRSDSFNSRFLKMSEFQVIYDLVHSLNFKKMLANNQQALGLRTMTEFFLRKFLNPYFHKSKHINFCCLNGMTSLIRSFYQNAALIISLVYSEHLGYSETQIFLDRQHLQHTERLIETTLRTLLTKETKREKKFDLENPLTVQMNEKSKQLESELNLQSKNNNSEVQAFSKPYEPVSRVFSKLHEKPGTLQAARTPQLPTEPPTSKIPSVFRDQRIDLHREQESARIAPQRHRIFTSTVLILPRPDFEPVLRGTIPEVQHAWTPYPQVKIEEEVKTLRFPKKL